MTEDSLSKSSPEMSDHNTSSSSHNLSHWLLASAAGSFAGLCEHTLLYPADTLKTRLQSVLHSREAFEYKSFGHAFRQIVRTEGPIGLFRGLPAVLMAAVPSHGVYFASYEFVKYNLSFTPGEFQPVTVGLAGIAATMGHDLIVTPFDVIKQRRQLRNCPYTTGFRCAKGIYKTQGVLGFVRSYPTTVLLNIPVMCTNFVTYETMKILLPRSKWIQEDTITHHLVAGGCAGAAAGFVSNPLDVVKTAIQTDPSSGYKSIRGTINHILEVNNVRYIVFFSGSVARVLYFIPSAAITWSVYETMKRILGFDLPEEYRV